VFCFDLGNTRAKLTWLPKSGEPRRLFAAGLEDLLSALSTEALAAVAQAPQPRLISSVCAREAAEELKGCLAGSGPVALNPPHGLILEVDTPESVGFDRLFAARGALEHTQANVIVVQLGTALTVDAVRWSVDRGHFLGGALHRGGARLPRIEPRPGVAALGRDTEGALASGVAVGLAGAARALVRGIAREAEMENATIVFTGGARDFLREALGELGSALIEDQHLLARGMAAGYGG
jgi:pantothenate kinase type III